MTQAEATSAATAEESRFTTEQTESDVKLAELEVRKNPLLPAITARQNELALEAARNRYRQALQDFENKKTTSAASIAIQKAAQNKAEVTAATQRKMIESMTLKAKSSGYVNVQQNTNQNMIYWGMQLPPFQLGDTARARHGGGADSGPQELGGERQHRRAGPRPPFGRPESDGGRGGPGRQVVCRACEDHRRHHRTALGPQVRDAGLRLMKRVRSCVPA